jgi:hypothetical protein
VPVVVGFYDETAAYAPDPADAFFKRLAQTSDTPGKPFYMPNGTPFFCTASGTLLKKGLAQWDTLPESERTPGTVRVPDRKEDPKRVEKDRRLTKPPANGLVLRTYVRGLKREGKRLFAPRVIDWEYNQKVPAEPNRDFLWLQEGEWKALVPDKPTKGQTVAVSDAVRDRVCHWHIAGGYHGLPGYYTAERFQGKEMSLVVEEATPQAVTLRLTGAARLNTGASYRFHGVLRYDETTKAFTRFDLIALCDEGAEPKKSPQNVAPFRHYGVAFELLGERTDDLLPPFYLRENVGTPASYFANRVR